MKFISSTRSNDSASRTLAPSFLATLFAWSTIPLPESLTEKTPVARAATYYEVTAISARVAEGDYLNLTLGELDKLRGYEKKGVRQSMAKLTASLLDKSREPYELPFERPLLILHPNGDWSILADVEFLPTPAVTKALKILKEEVAMKWLPAGHDWKSFDRKNILGDLSPLTTSQWTGVCFVSVSGSVRFGASHLLRTGFRAPIVSGGQAVDAILFHTQPYLHRLIHLDYLNWSGYINWRVEKLLKAMKSQIKLQLLVPNLPPERESVLLYIQSMLTAKFLPFHIVPKIVNWWASDRRLLEVDNPMARLRAVTRMFARIRRRLAGGGFENTEFMQGYDRFVRKLLTEILPFSINRQHPNWRNLRVQDVLTALETADDDIIQARRLSERSGALVMAEGASTSAWIASTRASSARHPSAGGSPASGSSDTMPSLVKKRLKLA